MIRPEILYVVHRTPHPPDKGDRIRSFHILKHLARRASVSLACLVDEPVSDDSIRVLRRHCDRLALVPLRPWMRWARALGSVLGGGTISEGAFRSPALAETLCGWAAQTRFRAAMVSASSLAQYLRLPELRHLPAIVDLVDVDSQKWADYASATVGPRAWLYRTEARRLRRLEVGLADWVTAATVVSEAEAGLLGQQSRWDRLHVLPNGVDLEYFHPPVAPVAESGCVFVGALDYLPNVDAAVWFCREAWPEIHRRHPQAHFRLVGRRPTRAICRLAAIPGVDVIGQVPDVRPYLASAAVVVAPLRIARGVQNKILEALAMAKAVVASPQALTGLQAYRDVPAVSAASREEWIEQVSHLLDDPPRRQRLAADGRRFVEKHHHWDHCLAPLDELLGLARHPAPLTSVVI